MADQVDVEAFLANIKVEFIDHSLDRMNELEAVIGRLKAGEGDWQSQFLGLQRHVHSLKGSAGSYGFHLVGQIAHRVEDYIETVEDIGPRQLDAIQAILDRIRAILEAGQDPTPEEAAAVLARLPKAVVSGAPHGRPETHALLIMPKGVQRKIIAQELAGWGMHLSMVDNGVDSIRAALCSAPGLIIASQELPDLHGDELARIFHMLSATEKCPFVLVTAYTKEDSALSDLPPDVAVIHKGTDFSVALRAQLDSWSL